MSNNKENKAKGKILTVRLGPEEEDMVETLKGAPYFLNMSKFMREAIRRFYESRVNKAGRVNKKEK